MKRKNVTRNALFTSIIAMLLCVSMLVGTTFAWFTDEVKSGNNVIAAGNLDVELYHSNAKDTKEAVTGNTVLFDEVSSKLWEPGALAYENFEVYNAGTLALKYKMNLKALDQSIVNGYKLGDVIKVGFKADGFTSTTREGVINEVTEWKSLTEFALSKNGVELAAKRSDTFGLVLYWAPNDDATDNHYNVAGEALYLTVGVELYATQAEAESDSFGIDYDQLATYPGTGMGNVPENSQAVEITVKNAEGQNVGTIVVPKDAIAESDKPVEVIYSESNYEGNFTVDADQETLVVDVTVLNLKEDNQEPIKATLKIPAGLKPDTVKLYHYDELIDSTYNPSTGDVTFYVKSFSPFTVVYDAESVYVPPVIEDPEEKLPKASVDESPQYVNTELPWGNFGQWSPTPGLEANLEAAYTFSCTETLEQAQNNPYAYWYCDFYVKLDKPLAENQIFLGGNYGSFGWVGFHNGDITLNANEEIGLLKSVTTNPWTYLDVVQNVGTFICGVGDVDDALAGATFTVMLRLTNPENADEFYNVATINYTFEDTTIDTEAELVKALADGEKEIEIEGNITLTKSLGATDVTLIGACEDAGINFNGYNIGGSGAITYKNLNLSTIALGADAGERGGWYGGIDYHGHSVATYENCTITGVFTTYSNTVNATNCTFNSYVQDGEEYYNIFLYSSGTVNATNCTFMYRDRGIKIYSEGANTFALNIAGGQFVATDDYDANKPLINVDSTYFESATIAVNNVKIDEKLKAVSLHNAEGNSKVTVTVQ